LAPNPNLEIVLRRLLERWPAHGDYVEKSFRDRSPDEMTVSERIAACALRLAGRTEGGLDALCDDYRFLCEKIVLPEEIHFRRHGRYRLASFADAMEECYANAPFMARYLNGLMLSNVLWRNHAGAIASYVCEYLPSVSGDLLEIGPGHGLLLSFAASRATLVAGWDISASSIARTQAMLDALGIAGVELAERDLFAADARESGRRFDAIVMSEILEHLEDPVGALVAAAGWLRPGGTVWVNVPANSPAPDHVFLVESPEHAQALVRAAGFEILAARAFPMTGATLERARKQKLTISCVVVGQKPAV
jgi:2-polyprenyl-3-methyl-5-hydroxy-6-metoxy-1,4-benzoquinol methylase